MHFFSVLYRPDRLLSFHKNPMQHKKLMSATRKKQHPVLCVVHGVWLSTHGTNKSLLLNLQQPKNPPPVTWCNTPQPAFTVKSCHEVSEPSSWEKENLYNIKGPIMYNIIIFCFLLLYDNTVHLNMLQKLCATESHQQTLHGLI